METTLYTLKSGTKISEDDYISCRRAIHEKDVRTSVEETTPYPVPPKWRKLMLTIQSQIEKDHVINKRKTDINMEEMNRYWCAACQQVSGLLAFLQALPKMKIQACVLSPDACKEEERVKSFDYRNRTIYLTDRECNSYVIEDSILKDSEALREESEPLKYYLDCQELKIINIDIDGKNRTITYFFVPLIK